MMNLPPKCLRVAAAFCVLTATLGCSEPKRTPSETSERAGASPPPAAVKLTVLVAGDQQLAEGVRLLRGEWKARSGGELEVSTIALDELATAESPQADLLIFPSRWLGALAERGALQ